MRTLTLTFELRTDQINADGTATINLRATYNRRHKRISTGRRVLPQHWDDSKKKVKRTHSNSVQINAALNRMEQQAWDYFHSSEKFTLSQLIRHLNGERDKDDLLLPFLRTVYEKERTRLQPSTTKQHLVMLNYLERFDKRISFHDVGYHLAREFQTWLRDQISDRDGKQLHANYIASIVKTLKRYLREAVRAGKITANPFEGEKVRTVESEKVYLTSTELARIEQVDVSSRRGYLSESLDMFLFSCYTGLAFIDLITLTRDHIQHDGKGLRLQKIRHKTRKSRVMLNLPLYMLFEGRPEKIAQRRLGGAYDELFGPFEEHFTATYNQHLKEFAALAKIEKNLSSHVGRHTCAMILLNEYRFTFDMVASVLGHTSIATTQKHYAKMLGHGLDERIRALDNSNKKD